MIYPSIQDLLKISPDKDGNQRLNKYMLVMATAKCARVITNEYLKDRKKAEKLIAEKKTEKELKPKQFPFADILAKHQFQFAT